MLYFSYGSNMSSRRLAARVPTARFITVARLLGHELRFHKIGRDGSGKCDIAMTDDNSNVVIGVVFDIPKAEKSTLDRYEGLGTGYEEKRVILSSREGETIEAITYYATHIDAALRPFHWYREHVIRGGREHNLPIQYLSVIESVVAIADHDPGRHARELGIYEEGRRLPVSPPL